MLRLRRHLSVANVLAGTAVFVALSGGAYAATTGGFVSNGRIHGCVTSKGVLTVVKAGKRCAPKTASLVFDQTGPRGAPGTNGAPGSNGHNGTNGTNGAPGAAAGFGATNSTPTPLTYVNIPLPPEWIAIPTVVATINLPAGSFVVQADLQVVDSSDSGPLAVNCFGINSGEGTITVGTGAGAVEDGSVAIGGTVTQTSAGAVNVLCAGPGVLSANPTITVDGTITATQVTTASG